MDIRLRSLADQDVRLEGLDLEISFAAGEEMRTEISTKFTRERLESVYAGAGPGAARLVHRRGRRLRAQPRGTCWVMQWMLPPPRRISRAGTPTTSRSGKARRRIAAASVVVARVEQRVDDPRVAEVEVDVGGGQAVAGRGAAACPRAASTPSASSAESLQRAGEGSSTTSKRAAAGVGRGFEPLARVAGDRVLGVVLVVGPGQQHDPGPGEAGEVVDVAVGLVFEDAGAEPDHLLGAEVVEQDPLDLLLGELRVAVRVEQALFGASAPCPRRRRGSTPPSSTIGAR